MTKETLKLNLQPSPTIQVTTLMESLNIIFINKRDIDVLPDVHEHIREGISFLWNIFLFQPLCCIVDVD